jgi:hypothetical protein
VADKDMHDWAEMLAGRDRPGADPQTAREARLLRQVVWEAHAQEASILDAEAKARIVAHLEPTGVVPPPEKQGITVVPTWMHTVAHITGNRYRRGALAMAALLLLVLNPMVLVHTWTGEAPSAQWQKHALAPQLVIYTKSPAEQAQAVHDLQSKLSGFSPRYYEVGTNQIVEVYIAWPAPQAFMDVLQHYQLRLPPLPEEDGLVRPWIRHLLQWGGLLQRPTRHMVIEVTHSSEG